MPSLAEMSTFYNKIQQTQQKNSYYFI